MIATRLSTPFEIASQRLASTVAGGWQEGYAALTVSASAVTEVQRYIQNQEEHHRQRSFREELELLLKRSGVEYDPKYLD